MISTSPVSTDTSNIANLILLPDLQLLLPTPWCLPHAQYHTGTEQGRDPLTPVSVPAPAYIISPSPAPAPSPVPSPSPAPTGQWAVLPLLPPQTPSLSLPGKPLPVPLPPP